MSKIKRKSPQKHPRADELITSGLYTSAQLAVMLNYHQASVNLRARKLGAKLPLPWYKLDHDFFKTRSPQMAWLVGMIASDGCINYSKSSKSYRLSFGIHKKDVELFNYYNYHLKSDKPFYYPVQPVKTAKKGKNIVRLQYSSKTIFDDLMSVGMTPRKSLTLKWIDLGQDLHSHLARGYFDGDGCVTSKRSGAGTYTITFVGTKEFLTGLRSVTPLPDGSIYRQTKNKNTWVLAYYAYRAAIIAKWMYNGSEHNTRLNRKYIKCLKKMLND